MLREVCECMSKSEVDHIPGPLGAGSAPGNSGTIKKWRKRAMEQSTRP